MLGLITAWEVCSVLGNSVSLVLIVHVVFGFAMSKALKSVRHTNAGLRDQRAAFQCKYLNSIGDFALST